MPVWLWGGVSLLFLAHINCLFFSGSFPFDSKKWLCLRPHFICWFKQGPLVSQSTWLTSLNQSLLLHRFLHPYQWSWQKLGKNEPLLIVLLPLSFYLFWPVFSNLVQYCDQHYLFLPSIVRHCPVFTSIVTSIIAQYYWVPIFFSCLCKVLLLRILATARDFGRSKWSPSPSYNANFQSLVKHFYDVKSRPC